MRRMFLAIAAGMSSPYLLLSAQPAWLRLLPKPGAWMRREIRWSRVLAPLSAIDLESSALTGPPILLAIEASMNSSMLRRVNHASAVG